MSTLRPQSQEFKPEVAPRKGEWIAWGLTLVIFLTWVILRESLTSLPFMATVFVIIFLLVSSSISLSNWMDRQTVLRIGEEGVWFTNGLRKVHLPWGDIQSVQVSPSQLGDRIQVQGESRYFAFRTLAEVMVKGELKGRMGFAEGEQILQVIIQQSGLKEKDHLGANTYYVRR